MLARCYCPTTKGYNHYGGRGIEVCDRWRHSFENFYEDMQGRPSYDHTLDRIDVNGNYTPENCRWATYKEQANNRRNCHNLTIEGVTKTISQWAEETGVKKSTILKRIVRQGMTPEDAIKQVEVKTLTHNGITKTIPEWADHLGCGYSTLQARIDSGDSVEDILRPLRQGRTVTFQGETLTICGWAKKLGISVSALNTRINVLGWDAEKALTTPVRPMKAFKRK